MKSLLTVLLLVSLHANASNVITYHTQFRGLQVGVSTIADVIDVLGPPLDKQANSNNVKYIFHGVHVTIQDRTGTINTIIIYEPDYTDANGLWVGALKGEVEYALQRRIDSKVEVDKGNGIVYWFEQGRIFRIVLAHQLKR